MPELMHLVSPYPPHAKINSQGLILSPYFISVFVYFYFVRDGAQWWTTLLKCAPIVSLMVYIVGKGFNFTKQYKCSQRILGALIFSCAGDALLNLDLFPHGMGAFAVAQIFYIAAFGWRPLKLNIGIPLYLAGAIVVAVAYKSLEGVLVFGLPIYCALLLTQCWRSVARAVGSRDAFHIFCAAGSILFVISDGLIAVDMFLAKVPRARILVMSTYYLAQFAIVLSTSDECKKVKASPKRSKKSVQSRINDGENGPRPRRPLTRD